MNITWYGHSAFRIDCGEAHILIDPFFTGNPVFDEDWRKDALDGLTHLALTHAHNDHVGDTIAIAKETGATVLANYEICNWLGTKGIENVDPGNTGGTLHHKGFSMTFVQAFHSSHFANEDGSQVALGQPNGLVFHFANGPSVFHMGDTDIFGDMALIHELHKPQIGLVPVGDRFTMGGAVAALACQRYFDFRTVIPCHYGTFPIIEETADAFVSAMEGSSTTVAVMQPGESLSLD